MSPASETRLAPRWLHGWAVLTAGATVVLLAVGAIVTTFQVGMADPIWPTYPWHLALIDWQEPKPGFVIEHTHRLAAYLVGCCVIVLAAGLWLSAQHSWLKWLGLAALGGVIVQGLLGGFRVRLHELFGTNLATMHGCFAQIVFSLLVSLVVLTSTRFSAVDLPAEDRTRLGRWSIALSAVVFLQLVWGALVRHTNGSLAQRFHLLTAFAVVAVAVWLVHLAMMSPPARRVLGRSLIVLGALLTLQIMLGVESWLGKFAGVLLPELHKPTMGQAIVRVSHVLVGSFILATSVVMAVLLYRPAAVKEATREPRAETNYRPTAALQAITNVVHHLEGTA